MTALFTRAGYLNCLPNHKVVEYLAAAKHEELWQQPRVRNLRIETLAALDLIAPSQLLGPRQTFRITPPGTRLLEHTRGHRNTSTYSKAAAVMGWSCVSCCREHYCDYGMWMAKADVWKRHAFTGDMVCIPCFEARLGRPIVADDLTDAQLNDLFLNNLDRYREFSAQIRPDPYWQTLARDLAKIGVPSSELVLTTQAA